MKQLLYIADRWRLGSTFVTFSLRCVNGRSRSNSWLQRRRNGELGPDTLPRVIDTSRRRRFVHVQQALGVACHRSRNCTHGIRLLMIPFCTTKYILMFLYLLNTKFYYNYIVGDWICDQVFDKKSQTRTMSATCRYLLITWSVGDWF